MKNTLSDLNNHLFEQLERLNDDDLTDEQLEKELERTKGISNIATKIIENADLAYRTMAHMDEYGYTSQKNRTDRNVPEMLKPHKDEAVPEIGGQNENK